MSDNPYSAPQSTETRNPQISRGNPELARKFTRFAAAMVDGILMAGVLMPIQFMTGYIERAQTQQLGVIEQLAMSFLGLLVMLALNGYLLYARGQTIGKMLTKIQIVDAETSNLLPFFKVYVLRYLWTLPVVLLVVFIPGTMDNLLLNIVVLIDVLMIFGVARRCLNDYIAGSSVVLYEEGRGRIA